MLLAGFLLRGGDQDQAGLVHHAVAQAILEGAYREEGERLLADTKRKLEAEEPIPGFPRLAEVIGRARAEKVALWLGLARKGDSWGGFLLQRQAADGRRAGIHCLVEKKEDGETKKEWKWLTTLVEVVAETW